MGHKCCFENSKVVGNSRAAHFTGASKSRGFENATTLRKDEFSKLLERRPPLLAKEFLNILGPIGIHPFLEISFRQRISQEKRGKPAMQETVTHLGILKGL